jgi:hypothetical protein
MTEYSRLAKGSFTATGTSQVVVLPFLPDYVELWNYSNIKTAAAHSVSRAWWDNKLIDPNGGGMGIPTNPTMIELYTANGTTNVFDTIQTNGISTFQGGIAQQYGATQQIIGITKAALARVNVTAHGYNVGDTVIMQGIALGTTNDFQLLNGVPFTIQAVSDANHFDIQWNTNQSTYTAISGSPAGALVKKVLYPFLYLPEDNVISAITTGATTTVVTTMYHNFETGQEIAFRIPTIWGTTQLNSLPNVLIPGQPVYGYVTSITDNWTFVCNINSSAFTAFTTNFTMTASTLVGLTYAQVLSVGDVNTGGNAITTTTPAGILYPSPLYPTSTNRVATINGPAIRGAFVNNTSQGFIIGPGTAAVDTTSTIMANTNIVLWHAYLHDFANP